MTTNFGARILVFLIAAMVGGCGLATIVISVKLMLLAMEGK